MSELVLINPRRRSKRRRAKSRRRGRMPPALARYWASRRGGSKRRRLRNPRRRRARRHVASMGTVRRKIRRRKLNPRRVGRRRHATVFRSRRRHRNPRFGIPSVRGIVKTTIMPAAIGAGGALALDVAMGYATPYLPAFLQSKWAMLAVKLAGAIGIGMVASRVLGRERGRVATLGAATVVVYGAAKSALSQALPTVKGLSGYTDFVDYSLPRQVGAYIPNGVGFYSPAATIAPSGVGAYMPPGMHGLEGVDGYNWQSDGM